MENNKFGNAMESMFKGMDHALGTKTVVGEAIRIDDDTFILPLVDVSFGMGAGANVNEKYNTNLGGGGMGAKMSPSAVLLVQKGKARIINIQEEDKVVHFLESVPDLVGRVTSLLHKDPRVEKAVEEAFDKMEI